MELFARAARGVLTTHRIVAPARSNRPIGDARSREAVVARRAASRK